MLTPTANPETIKELNRRLVFDQIRQHTISRVEIAQATKLSKAAVSLIVAELIAVGLVEETGNGKSPAGRPRVLLQPVKNARLALGAELTNEECRVVLTNLVAEPLVSIVRPTTDTSYEGLLALLETCVEETTRGVDLGAILGLGVSVPGVVHSPEGLVIAAVLLGWQNVRLG